MAQQPQKSPNGRAASQELDERGWHPVLIVCLAVVLVLPAVGMIVGGFSQGRFWLGLFGLGLFLALGAGYLEVAWLVLRRRDDTVDRE